MYSGVNDDYKEKYNLLDIIAFIIVGIGVCGIFLIFSYFVYLDTKFLVIFIPFILYWVIIRTVERL